MATSDEKQIAKEILLKAMEEKYLLRSEFPSAETAIDMACKAYEKILETVTKN